MKSKKYMKRINRRIERKGIKSRKYMKRIKRRIEMKGMSSRKNKKGKEKNRKERNE